MAQPLCRLYLITPPWLDDLAAFGLDRLIMMMTGAQSTAEYFDMDCVEPWPDPAPLVESLSALGMRP